MSRVKVQKISYTQIAQSFDSGSPVFFSLQCLQATHLRAVLLAIGNERERLYWKTAVGARRRRAKSAKDNPGACQKPPKEDSGHEGGPEASLKKIAEVEICDGAFMWHNSTPASLLVRRLHGEPQKTYYSFAPLNGCMVEAMVMTGRDQFVGDLVRKLAKDKHISVHVDTLIVSVKTTVKEHTFEEMMMTVRVLADALKRVRRIAWADF